MRPFKKTIIEIFDGKRRYLIPHYQRQYAWRIHPQLELLWKDITTAADKLEVSQSTELFPHFMGAIVISQLKTFGKQLMAFEGIDGQQRITTFQIILSALHKLIEDKSPAYASEVAKFIFNEGIMEEPAIERYKLWPSRIDRPTYIKLIDPEATSLARMREDDDAEGFTRPAIDAHAFFEQAIRARIFDAEELDEFRLEKLFEALKDKLAVVSIELEGGDDPQTIFETLNSRGEPLTASDLMRNFIFQRAVGLGQKEGSLISDQLYEEHWLPLDRSYWRVQESRGRQLKPRLDWMLVDHLSAKQAALVSADQLFSRYRSWIIEAEPYGGDIPAELQAITDAAAVSKAIFDQDATDPLGRFGVFTNAFDVSTTTSLVVYLATEARLGGRLPEALKLIESYIVARDICKLTTANYNKFFVDCIAAVRRAEGDKIAALARYLTASTAVTTRWPEDSELKHAWLNKPQYKPGKQARLRLILEALESVMNAGADVEVKSGLTIEHIMPQTWKVTWPISPTPGIEPDDLDIEMMQKEIARDTQINVMGNLTLLTQPLNSEVSNGSFAIKMPAVKRQSGLALNRELQAYNMWDEEMIMQRALRLLTIAQTVWPRPA